MQFALLEGSSVDDDLVNLKKELSGTSKVSILSWNFAPFFFYFFFHFFADLLYNLLSNRKGIFHLEEVLWRQTLLSHFRTLKSKRS